MVMGISRSDDSRVGIDIQEEGIDVSPSRAGSSMRTSASVLGSVWNHRILLQRFVVCSFLLSIATAFLLHNQYTSTARVIPADPNPNLGISILAGGSSGNSSLVNELTGGRTPTATAVEILKSRTVADDLIAKFRLQSVYRTWPFAEATLPQTRATLADRTSITDDRKSGMITISVSDRLPARAAAMANEYIAQLNNLASQLDTSAAHREKVFLGDRISELQSQLQQSAERFSIFASKNTALDIPAQGKAMVDAVGRLQGEMIATQSQLQGAEQIYGPDNVHVKSLMAQEASLNDQLRNLVGREASAKATAVPNITQLPALGREYASLSRDVAMQQAVYESLTKQFELAKVQEAGEAPIAKVLDAPDVPVKKSSPKRLLIIGLGTLAGAFSGILWAVALDAWLVLDDQDPRKLILRGLASGMELVKRIGLRG